MKRHNYYEFKYLETEMRTNGVVLVTLNRPEVLNAWNKDLILELIDLFRTVDRDPNVRVIVVTGAGNAFSVGGDHEYLEVIMSDPDRCAVSSVKEFADFVRSIVDLDKPVIAAINGDVVGGGVSLALLSDISLMSDTARIVCGGQLHIAVTPAEAPYLWPFLCSMAKVKYLLLTSKILDAREAERVGLVSDVFPHEELLERALMIAEQIAQRDPLAVAWTKRAANHYLRQAAPNLDFALASEGLTFLRPAAKDGLAALRRSTSKRNKRQAKGRRDSIGADAP